MEHVIKKISGNDFQTFNHLINAAFPGMNADKWLEAHIKVSPNEHLFGLYKRDTLVAGMRCFDFEMNFSQTPINVGGVGMIAVDMLHKKEKNAYHLMQYFLDRYKQNNTNMVMLYPFKVSFYKQMGFGMGTKTYQFYIKPIAFNDFKKKDHLIELYTEDRELMLSCYNRVYEKTHGMTRRIVSERELNRPFQFGRVIGFKDENDVKGYFVYEIVDKDLYIHELFFENPAVIKEFSTFFNQQSDQIDRIIMNANEDDLLHFVQAPESGQHSMLDVASAPDNKHVMNTSTGVMYRVINTQGLFTELQEKNHIFNKVTINIKFNITDSFYPANNEVVIVQFEDGKVVSINKETCDVEVKLDISEFSSLVMGSFTFKKLIQWGLAEISNTNYINTITQLFHTETPTCTKAF